VRFVVRHRGRSGKFQITDPLYGACGTGLFSSPAARSNQSWPSMTICNKPGRRVPSRGVLNPIGALPEGGSDGWGILLGEGVMIMEKFIHDENLKLFRKRLVEATNETQRQLILFLIKEEEAKTPAIQLSKIKGPD
jgi:hypothetical protein